MPNHDVIIPMDRLGVLNIQKNPMKTLSYINKFIKKGINVNWIIRPSVLKTPDFPEGHIYDPGGFLLSLNDEDYSMLCGTGLKYADILEYVADNHIRLNKKKIAVYVGIGSAEFCFKPLMEVLDLAGFGFEGLDDKDIRNNLIDDFDILIVPGGPDAGESFYHGLGDMGYDNIKNFLYNKGQYFGICAGAYLPLKSDNEDNIWLNIVDATDDGKLDYWRTGTGFVRIKIDENDHPFVFGLTKGNVNTVDMVYWEGPAFNILNKNKVKALAYFDEFIASGNAISKPTWDILDNYPAFEAINNWYNIMSEERFITYLKGMPAVIESKINYNKILLYSPHAEFGNIGATKREFSEQFLMISNALFYLGT